MVFYSNEEVIIQNCAPCWNGKIGKVIRWIHDDWYIVKCNDVELVLDASRDEMVQALDISDWDDTVGSVLSIEEQDSDVCCIDVVESNFSFAL